MICFFAWKKSQIDVVMRRYHSVEYQYVFAPGLNSPNKDVTRKVAWNINHCVAWKISRNEEVLRN